VTQKYQNALFCVVLLALTVGIYRTKMEFDPPKGTCLTAWRVTFFGVGIVFATVTLLVLLGPQEYSAIWVAPIGLGLFSAFAGILLGLTNGCTRRKQ